MKKINILGLLMTLFVQPAFAEELFVDKKALGDLSLQTETINSVTSFAGKELMGQVSYLPGSPYVFKSPINVQQIEFLQANGTNLEKSQAFAKIKGPEVHHFYAAYEMKKVLYEQASRHFTNSQKLFKNKSLSEQAWLDISNDYHTTKMEFDELQHFFDLVLRFDEKEEALILISPLEAVLQYSLAASLDANMTIASFVPLSSIKLKVKLPLNNANTPIAFEVGSCQLALDYLETTNSAFHQTAWSEGLKTGCDFSIGQVVSAIPLYETDAYQVKKSTVVSWEGQQYIFIESGSGYRGVAVSLVASQSDDYIVQSDESLANKVVLTSSVSAVQGTLQGLGL